MSSVSLLRPLVTAGSQCTLKKNHAGDSNAAEVCQAATRSLQNRADLMEAALHVDLKEAAQVIYEAVWAGPFRSHEDLPECGTGVADGIAQARGNFGGDYTDSSHVALTRYLKRSSI